jgi:hypothetical protein
MWEEVVCGPEASRRISKAQLEAILHQCEDDIETLPVFDADDVPGQMGEGIIIDTPYGELGLNLMRFPPELGVKVFLVVTLPEDRKAAVQVTGRREVRDGMHRAYVEKGKKPKSR